MNTIAAISTPIGQGGIGIVRISGEKALEIVKKVFKTKKESNEFKSYTMKHGYIVDNDEVLDEVLVSYFKAPNSYTGEDTCEINCHGGNVVVKRVLELVLQNGAILAEPGEFTKRAFLNGKMDLSQAEAVIDVIKSRTDKAQEVAQNQLEGSLAKKIKDLRFKVTEVLAQIEVSIDFSDEDVEDVTYKEIEEKALELKTEIKKLYDSAESGKILRR